MRLLFLIGLLSWTSLAALKWATYFYRSSIEVRNATLRAYSAEEKLNVIDLERRRVDPEEARTDLQGTVFDIARRPLSTDENEYPSEVLRGRLEGQSIIVRSAERQRLRHQLRRKMIMLAGEGSLLVGLLFACLVALYRMLMGELHLRRHQESFVHSVTHELKSPLTGLRSLLQSLATLDIPKADRATYVELGVREIDRLDQLVANILLSSRLEAAAFKPQITTVDVTVTLKQLHDAKSRLFDERGGVLKIESPETLSVRADPQAMNVILQNLVDNALKYSPDKPTVHLSVRRDGIRVLIELADHGIGLEAADQARIFRKFYRAPTGELNQAKGSGLGLFIARGLARSLHGDLTVRKRPERATGAHLH